MVALDESLPGAAHAEDRLRRDEMIWIATVRADGQPKYERTLREVLGSTAAEMSGALSTTLRIRPTRWRVGP